MFEKIVLRRSEGGQALTAGELAQALLFYQNVHIILDHDSLSKLIPAIGMPRLLSLLSRPNVSAIYCEQGLGTKTDNRGGLQSHSFIAYTWSGDQTSGKLHSRKKRLAYSLVRKGYKKKQAKKFAERFMFRAPLRSLTEDYFVKGGILKAAWQDLFDQDYIHEAVRRSLIRFLGEEIVPSAFIFRIHPNHPYFSIETNLDFQKINEKAKQLNPSINKVTPAKLINNVLMARSETILAANYGGEFHTSSLTSEIIRLRYAELLRRIGIEKEELDEFKDVVIPDVPSVQEVIDSGERTFDEFLSVLDKSQKFRDWMQGVNPDEKLLTAYFRDVTSEGWIGGLPSKALRYVLGTLVGVFKPGAGLALSAADSFLLDRIVGGWRPSHFVERRLRPFLDVDDEK